jgi:transposase
VVGTILASSDLKRTSRKGCPNHAVEFKRRLAMAACEPGISVAKLALEHRINANLLFKWRRQYRAGKFGEPNKKHAAPVEGAKSLPAAMTASPSSSSFQLLPVVESVATVAVDGVAGAGSVQASIEVVFPCARVRIHRGVEPAVLRVVLDCLARRR